MDYLRYHIASGAVLGRVSVDPALVPSANSDIALIEGDGTVERHWISNGAIVTRSTYDMSQVNSLVPQGLVSIPVVSGLPLACWLRIRGTGNLPFEERLEQVIGSTLMFVPELPGRYIVTLAGEFTGPEMIFEVIELADLKQRRNDEVTARKALASTVGVEWNGHRWDASPDSLAQVKGYLYLPLPENFYWTSFAGEDVPIDEAGLTALAGAIVTFTFAVHDRSRVLKAAIQNAASIEEVRAIDVDAGWPS